MSGYVVASDAASFDAEQPGEKGSIVSLAQLPPMPTPNYKEMRSEAACGCLTVFLIVSGLVALTHSLVFGGFAIQSINTARLVCYILIWSEAGIALLCLLGLMLDDPGTVKRSPAACFPLPPEVEEKLLQGQSLSDMRNVIVDGRAFCVRCCIWRDGGGESRFAGVSTTHHCDTCQRCVDDFDHHCGVFGRCIAGEGLRGNMKYFKTIIYMAAAGIFTAIGTMVVQAI